MSIQLIQQAICYMEEHIYEKINYAEVAKSVHMSSYNFHRTFSFIAGMTANGYTIWDTRPADYVVFKCFGPDSDCLGETWSKFLKNFLPRRVMCRRTIRIMKSISKTEKKICSASYGFLSEKSDRRILLVFLWMDF